ncbi:MAG: hypothetical protein RLZZ09_814 [Pseudomonadota bacterium]|jgi:hypothetical protein
MTRPSDIPADVWEAAKEAGAAVFDGAVDLYETGIETISIPLVIARAILAERERAARVCEDAADEADDRLNRTGSEQFRRNYAAAHVTCKRLATAIRSAK